MKVAWHAIAQQSFHGPCRVRHTCRQSWAFQPRTRMRLRESNSPRRGCTSHEAISALRHTDRRLPSPDDWNRWCTLEVERVPCLGLVTASMHTLYVFHTRYRGTPPSVAPRGKPRTARRFAVYKNCPLATSEDRQFFILTYLKTSALQVVQGRLFGMGQSKANQWIHVFLPVLLGQPAGRSGHTGAHRRRRCRRRGLPQRSGHPAGYPSRAIR